MAVVESHRHWLLDPRPEPEVEEIARRRSHRRRDPHWPEDQPQVIWHLAALLVLPLGVGTLGEDPSVPQTTKILQGGARIRD